MEAVMTAEEQLIKRYFDAFNRHDLEGVVACFHDQAVLDGPSGNRRVGLAEVRRSYETEFALYPDAHCDLRVCTGNSGRGVAESYFTGTRAGHGKVEAVGAEVMEIVDGKIKEIRDYHHTVAAKAASESRGGALS
jgi:ketosteroid isomerase-like protein